MYTILLLLVFFFVFLLLHILLSMRTLIWISARILYHTAGAQHLPDAACWGGAMSSSRSIRRPILRKCLTHLPFGNLQQRFAKERRHV